jgi:hypothetical protein
VASWVRLHVFPAQQETGSALLEGIYGIIKIIYSLILKKKKRSNPYHPDKLVCEPLNLSTGSTKVPITSQPWLFTESVVHYVKPDIGIIVIIPHCFFVCFKFISCTNIDQLHSSSQPPLRSTLSQATLVVQALVTGDPRIVRELKGNRAAAKQVHTHTQNQYMLI